MAHMKGDELKTCSNCELPILGEPQPYENHEPVYRKVNGWVGNQFIPYESKVKAVKIRKTWLCGYCYATKEIEVMREGSKDVNELETALLAIAYKEVAARVNDTATTPDQKSSKSKTTTKRRKREPMTPDQARSFGTYSAENATTVVIGLECACEPYKDVFTYNRWKAQGFQVQKGMKSIRIPVFGTSTGENDDGEVVTNRYRTVGRVFCKCQVKAVA